MGWVRGRLHLHIDFVVCLGGDGVILHASALFKRAIPPVGRRPPRHSPCPHAWGALGGLAVAAVLSNHPSGIWRLDAAS